MKSSIESPLAAPAANRMERLDALRALAMLWMAAFHFAFDLNHFQLLSPKQNFYVDPFWTLQRTCIVSMFLFCAGLGQAVALQAGWPRFWKRWAQIAGCAVLVSIGSAVMFPRSWIFFGVLHGMAVMLVLVRLTAHWGRWLWLAGALALAAPPVAASLLAQSPWENTFNAGGLSWLGLITAKPITEDYVPVLPWLGVVWWGMAAGQALLRQPPAWLTRPMDSGPLALLAAAGRWSLSYYLLHQPVLIGLLLATGWLLRA